MSADDEIYEEALKIIGKRLREIRLEKGYTNYEKFAFAHDLNRSKYGKYENGSNMRLTTLIKILLNADIDPTYFFSTISEELLNIRAQNTKPKEG